MHCVPPTPSPQTPEPPIPWRVVLISPLLSLSTWAFGPSLEVLAFNRSIRRKYVLKCEGFCGIVPWNMR